MEKREGATLQVKKRLNRIKVKVNAKFSDIDWLMAETDDIIEEFMRNGGYHPIMEIPNQLSLMSALLAKTHENIERMNISQRSREEWAEIELQFIPSKPLDIPDCYKVCGCWNCNQLFKRRGKTKYCSEKCRQEQMDANDRFEKTGTYLALYRDKYRPKRDETAERMRKEKEVHLTEKMAKKVPTIDYGINGKIKPKYKVI
ncbi:hypothetical protein J7E79_25275 [Bacillus sp. ISL-40]|uniref:hypothetical protein n=1 Tax=unclassified Bacillus (in: firmicutes) TaxID=185979 RepID=UPI001BEA1D92|nr:MULTISPECIES: hypothetical protein [unclassified Bacillus (in: firmicutes)]MBT2700652.1 hypothetical protein [Bacillus sp. ISL-40]MBT2722350.1 hypothetical protein [Bacillus sp. ISL-46]MBT2743353.1 hypothetical protein [Bacillus sp. ISL-77]